MNLAIFVKSLTSYSHYKESYLLCPECFKNNPTFSEEDYNLTELVKQLRIKYISYILTNDLYPRRPDSNIMLEPGRRYGEIEKECEIIREFICKIYDHTPAETFDRHVDPHPPAETFVSQVNHHPPAETFDPHPISTTLAHHRRKLMHSFIPLAQESHGNSE
jgi:hypothetical protein